MVHEHQRPVSQAEQTSCDKAQTFLTGARILTMCLSPNCLMPESQVYQHIKDKIEFQHSNVGSNSEHSAEKGNDTHELVFMHFASTFCK
jgi:hypothetical protein